MEALTLQDEFATRVARSPTVRWDEIRIRYENVTIKGVPFEIFVASLYLDGARHDLSLPLEALDLLVKLQATTLPGQSEQWQWLEFTLRVSGKYRFDFKYDAPPNATQQARFL